MFRRYDGRQMGRDLPPMVCQFFKASDLMSAICR